MQIIKIEMKLLVQTISLLFLSSISQYAFSQDDLNRMIEERKAKIYAKRDSIMQAHQQLIMQYSNDSLNIRSTGKGNMIQIDSLQLSGATNQVIKHDWTNGKIEQDGEDNSVKIQSEGSSSPKNVEIKQTGNNNKVIIRSGSINPK